MRDYRYIDSDRLRSYVEQIRAGNSSAKRERKSSLKFSLGFLTAFVEETKLILELSEHEQIEELLRHLRRNYKLREKRPVDEELGPDFVFETCEAFDVYVPVKGLHESNDVLRFWMSVGDDTQGTLCLLEKFTFDDNPHVSFSKMSTFSALASFVHHSRERVDSSLLARWLPAREHPYRYAKIDETHLASHHHEYYNVESFVWEFIVKPDELLRNWGCHVARPKQISTLYRIREFGNEAAYGWRKVSVFGYPIAVWIDEASQETPSK